MSRSLHNCPNCGEECFDDIPCSRCGRKLSDMTAIHDPRFVQSEQALENSIDTFIELREEISKLRSIQRELLKRLQEMPDSVLENEKKNPAWNKSELWGIERDIIPSIRALCMSAAHLIEK